MLNVLTLFYYCQDVVSVYAISIGFMLFGIIAIIFNCTCCLVDAFFNAQTIMQAPLHAPIMESNGKSHYPFLHLLYFTNFTNIIYIDRIK